MTKPVSQLHTQIARSARVLRRKLRKLDRELARINAERGRRKAEVRTGTWSPEEEEQLRALYPHTRTTNVATDLRRTVSCVFRKARNLGLAKSEAYLASPAACRLRRGDEVGKAYRFPKGHVPANKGIRRPGWHRGRMRETQFKRGTRQGRAAEIYQPIGHERISKDGYLERKIHDGMPLQSRWKSVHRIVWEAAHGPVPASHAVCFKPGMRTAIASAITVDNLELVSRRALLERNTVQRFPPELRAAIQLKGAVQRQINKRLRTA